jgi:hypothetical protein
MYARFVLRQRKIYKSFQTRLDHSLVFVEPDFLGCLASFRVLFFEDRGKFFPPSLRNITSLCYSLSFDRASTCSKICHYLRHSMILVVYR